jgi:hypothetical protein
MNGKWDKRVRALNVLVVGLAVACSRETRRAVDTAKADLGPNVDAPAATPAGATKASYVGLQYDSLPGDVTYKDGSVIPPNARTHNAEYDLAHVVTPRGEMVWLDTLGAPVGKGLRAKIVRAELTVPPLANDERLFLASCDANGRLDPTVVALVVNEPNATRFTKIRQAWRVNIRAARFDLIPVTGITCEDPGS